MHPWRNAIFVLVSVLVGCGGASKEAGRGAAEGALNQVQQQSQHPDQGPPALEGVGRDVVRGALSELDRPETRAELARIAGSATQGALASAAGQTAGPAPAEPPQGGGPAARSG